MLKNEIEQQLYETFRNRWLTDDTGGSYLRILAACTPNPQMVQFVKKYPEQWTFNNINEYLKQRNFVNVDDTTRFLVFSIEDLADEGRMIFADSIYNLLWPDGREIKDHSFCEELDSKYFATLKYLNTNPWDYFKQLIPFGDELLDMIIRNPKLFYCKSAVSTIGATFAEGYDIPLGLWATLWKSGIGVAKCHRCASVIYLLCLRRGLSIGQSKGICSVCGHIEVINSGDSFNDVYDRVRELGPSPVRPFRIDMAVKYIQDHRGQGVNHGRTL